MPKLFKETKFVLMPTAAIAIAKEYSAIDLIILMINCQLLLVNISKAKLLF